MKSKTPIAVGVALVLVVLVSASALAMGSPNFRLDWYTPLNSGGGGPSTSTTYMANFTIGQTAVGASSSANYKLGLGYWSGVIRFTSYLPMVVK